MQYMGGKFYIRKQIASYLNTKLEGKSCYVEPFVGAGHVLQEIPNTIPRYASDNYIDLINLHKAIQNGWIPPNAVTRDEHYLAKKGQFESHVNAFISICCSYGGDRHGGFAVSKRGRDFTLAGKKSLLNQRIKLLDVVFTHSDYSDLCVKDNSLVYCDPPYKNYTGYSKVEKFDSEKFWNWVRLLSKRCEVYVSEYTAPEDFECVLTIPTKINLQTSKNSSRTEKLFKYRG